MNMVWAIAFLVGGLLILWKCAELLVTAAVALAKGLGVSPLVIGLTVVAMGTSAPEVAASIAAALKGVGDVAIGNVYGSNIANLALVGGLCALIRPIRIQLRTLRREIPVMLLVVLLLWPVLHNLHLSRPEGFLLLAVFAGLILLTVYLARKESVNSSSDGRNTQYAIRNTKQSVLFVIVGLVGLALGADLTVRGAVFIGERVGLSKAVIGLTIIAIGTSLPELATCLAAAVKGQHDISIGNLVGSNVFNTLLVTGTAGVIRPFTIVQRLAGVDYWIMIIVSAAFASAALLGRRIIGRAGGTLLLCGYVSYMVYLLAFSR
jgi:cation:H+ antiporter